MNTLQQSPSTSTGMDNSHINMIGGIQHYNRANKFQQTPSTSTGIDTSRINLISSQQHQNLANKLQQTPSTITGMDASLINSIGGIQPQNQANTLQALLTNLLQQTPGSGGLAVNQKQIHSTQNMIGNKQQTQSGQTANQNQLNSIQNMLENNKKAQGSSGQAANQNQVNSIPKMLGNIQQAPGSSGQATNQNQVNSIQNMLGTMQQTPGLSGQASNQNQVNSIQNMLGTMQHTPGLSGQASNQNQLLSIQNMLENKQNNVPFMSTTNFATKQQQHTGQPSTSSNSLSNPQDNVSVLLQTLLKQNNLGTNTNQDLQNSNQHFGLNGLLSNANMVPHTNINQQNNPNILNTPTDTNLATAQRIVNIQMQNALQPQDFGLSGGHDISHINTFGHSTNNLAAQMNPNMFNIQNLLQGNSLLQSMPSTQNQGHNMLFGHNLPQNNMMNNMLAIPITKNHLQNSINNNQGLRQLLQRNIQQILMQQNNQIMGAQGFLGLNNATKSFPNNQLAPSDVVIDNTTRNSTGTTVTPSSIKVGAIETLNLTVNPTKPSLFSTFETSFPTKQVLVDTLGSMPMETLNTLPTKHVLDNHGSMTIETLNSLPTKHI
ncbi:unnamed protein product [Mytilus edulis]|uniref:Uncharacterized protein n=1 Tax=Mytilus edulis TaxID=6550 RepID=A0A8S3UJJ9_MYTED|nr:unnamed protein product [Mytilus edulis]